MSLLWPHLLPYYTEPSPRTLFFFFNDTATTEIYTLSLHDALPICPSRARKSTRRRAIQLGEVLIVAFQCPAQSEDRKSTRLNSSHSQISYAVFCLKKKSRFPRTPSSITSNYRAYIASVYVQFDHPR